MKKFLAIVVAVIALAACGKETTPAGKIITLTGSVILDSDATKVAPDAWTVGGTINFHWELGDKVILANLDMSVPEHPTVAESSIFTCSAIDSEDPTKADFTGEALSDMTNYIVGYAGNKNCNITVLSNYINEDPLVLQNATGNYNVMITGLGNASGFALDQFIDNIGLQLTGDGITLGKIEYYDYDKDEDKYSLKITLNFGTDGLALTAVKQDVWIPVYSPTDGFTLKFYDTANNLIFEKSSKSSVCGSTVVVFPTLDIYPGTSLLGITIDGVTWAPVNCGYDATHTY